MSRLAASANVRLGSGWHSHILLLLLICLCIRFFYTRFVSIVEGGPETQPVYTRNYAFSQASAAGPQPAGWDWPWETILAQDFNSYGHVLYFGLTTPYDGYSDDALADGLPASAVFTEAAKLEALAGEGLVWTAIAENETDSGGHTGTMGFESLRLRWGWTAASGAVRVEALLGLENWGWGPWGANSTNATFQLVLEDDYAVFVRDSRGPHGQGPFIAAVMNIGSHPTVLTSRWGMDNSDGSTYDSFFDDMPGLNETAKTKYGHVALSWDPPHVPSTLVVNASIVLRRAAKGVRDYVLDPQH